MRVKKYVVNSMAEALQQIRSDLGKDAVILTTKPIKTGGFLGMFRKRQLEVIAAIEPEEEKGAERSQKTMLSPSKHSRLSTPVPATKEETGEKAPFSAILQTAAFRTQSASNHDRKKEEQENRVSRELDEMRSMLWKLVMADTAGASLPKPFLPIRQRLIGQDVAQDIVGLIFEKVIKELELEKLQDERQVRQKVKETIIDIVREANSAHGPLRDTTAFVNVVGPTGVGKTTTLAKLAAESVLRDKKRIGMLTSDTYRMAAVEQLKTYANILNVPLKVVYSPEELATSVERLAGCDLLFMDTAGRNYRNKEYVDEINKLLQSPLPSETFLVLSLTAKHGDLETVVESFKETRIDKVIFTKIDETGTYGSILNLVVKYKLALSYFTTGQNVPDDIEIATPEKVATMLLGELCE